MASTLKNGMAHVKEISWKTWSLALAVQLCCRQRQSSLLQVAQQAHPLPTPAATRHQILCWRAKLVPFVLGQRWLLLPRLTFVLAL